MASVSNATQRPFGLIVGPPDGPLPGRPAFVADTSEVVRNTGA